MIGCLARCFMHQREHCPVIADGLLRLRRTVTPGETGPSGCYFDLARIGLVLECVAGWSRAPRSVPSLVAKFDCSLEHDLRERMLVFDWLNQLPCQIRCLYETGCDKTGLKCIIG